MQWCGVRGRCRCRGVVHVDGAGAVVYVGGVGAVVHVRGVGVVV